MSHSKKNKPTIIYTIKFWCGTTSFKVFIEGEGGSKTVASSPKLVLPLVVFCWVDFLTGLIPRNRT